MARKYTKMEILAEEVFKRKEAEETKRNHELVKLRMENELVRKFLYEAGRR